MNDEMGKPIFGFPIPTSVAPKEEAVASPEAVPEEPSAEPPIVPPDDPLGLTEEDKEKMRKLLAIYDKSAQEQGDLLATMDLPRIHEALAKVGGRTVFATFVGVNRQALDAIGSTEGGEHGAYGSVILSPGAETPDQLPQLLLQPGATGVFLRFLRGGVHSLVRMHGLASLGPLLDLFDSVGEQMISVKRAMAERGRLISEMVEKAFAEQELEEWKKSTGGGLA